MLLYCAGCGAKLFSWEGETLSYTHSCGATAFSKTDPMKSRGEETELDQLVLPKSFWNYFSGLTDDIPHLEYYVGRSNAVNPLKSLLKKKLKEVGSVSEADCIICKSRVLRANI